MKKDINSNQKLTLIAIPFIIILGIIALIASQQLVNTIKVKRNKFYCNKDYVLKNNMCEKELKEDVFKIGDINRDNSIDIVDFTTLQNYIDNKIELDDYQKILADVNKDNSIDIIDTNILKNYLGNKNTIKSYIGNITCQDSYQLKKNYCIKKESIKPKKK